MPEIYRRHEAALATQSEQVWIESLSLTTERRRQAVERAFEQLAERHTPGPPGLAPVFRTSIYFHRSVHDVLRDIAHDERKSITDLINEGLDHVLAKRNYPGTADLRRKK